jgi:putative phage-type endonuclease
MEDRLTEWLLENRPYTRLNTRIKQFVLFCKTLQPGLSTTRLRREVLRTVDTLFLGDLGRLWMRDRCYERVLRMYGANDQRSDAWHAKRGEMITASEVYQVLGSESARREVMMRKLEPRPSSEGSAPIPALLWGTRFEPVAKKIYEERTHCEITDVSCVQHPRYAFLGASPDGLIVPTIDDPRRYGRLIEFKCPISRKPTDDIPPGYVHQMQMQMECTGIDECEYVEFRFKTVRYTEWVRSKETKGCFAVYESGRVEYDCDCAGVEDETAQILYWILQSIQEQRVQRDPAWLPTVLPILQSTWNEVLAHRANGTRPEEVKTMPSLDL